MKVNSIIFILIIVTIILGGIIIYDKNKFPIKFKVCDVNYSDCVLVARFDDIHSCEATKEKWSWYCDTTVNPAKPDCHIEKSSISASFCSE